MSPAEAYAIAVQYGSYISSTDYSGRCFYAFYVNDARPVSEAHRQECIAFTEEQILVVRDQIRNAIGFKMTPERLAELYAERRDLIGLAGFFRTTELNPMAAVDEAA